jgi:membrane fusion protein (multidrug efflux system)
MKMNKCNIVPFLIVASFVILTGCKGDSEQPKFSNSASTLADFVVLKELPITDVLKVPGTVLPNEQVMLYPEVTGIIEKILFKEGQQVKKGQVLVEIDRSLILAEKEQLKAELQLAELQLKRQKQLLENRATSTQAFEEAEHRVISLNTQIQTIDVTLDKHLVRAPFDGRIGLRDLSLGALINSSTVISQLADLSKFKIEFAINQEESEMLSIGDTIHFSLPHLNRKIRAVVYAEDAFFDRTTRMKKMRAITFEQHTHLRGGEFVNIEASPTVERTGFLVPSIAISPVLNGQQIWKVDNGKATAVLVDPGVRTNDKIEIRADNIKAGDTILVTGLLAMREGAKIQFNKKVN